MIRLLAECIHHCVDGLTLIDTVVIFIISTRVIVARWMMIPLRHYARVDANLMQPVTGGEKKNS